MDVIPIMRPWLGAAEERGGGRRAGLGLGGPGSEGRGLRGRGVRRARARRTRVATTSCTTALHLALHALGVGPGDEVVVPSLSFIATANAPRYVGARPVFADVDLETQNVTPETVERALTPATRAVIVVHQAGMPADVDAIEAVCAPRGVAVIEDAACAIGSTYRGRPVGARASWWRSSFHPRKLVTTGEGGMLLDAATPTLARRLRRLREHGMAVSAHERHASGDRRARAVRRARLQLPHDGPAGGGRPRAARQARRHGGRAPARSPTRYREALAGVPGLGLPGDPPYGTTNYQSYVVRLDDELASRAATRSCRRCSSRGIATRRGIMAAHLEPACAGLPAPRAARDRAPDPPLADPAAVPRHGRRPARAGRARRSRQRRGLPTGRWRHG